MDSAGVTEIGSRLRAARLRRGMTLEVLAGLAGLSSAYLSMIENGKRRLDRYSLIIALADALAVAPGELAPGMAGKRRRLAARRKAVGLSQEQLAEFLKVDRSTVGRWENGETEPQPWIRPKLARTLRVSADQLNDLLSDPDPGPAAGMRSVPSDLLTERGSVPPVPDVLAPAAVNAGESARSDVVDVFGRIQKLSRGIVNQEVITYLRANTWDAVAQYEKLDHSDLAPALVKQRAWLTAVLDGCSHPVQRQQLFEIAATTSGMLGYVAVGRADFPLARAYCLESFHLGDFAQDAGLQAWARGMQSFCEYYAGRYDNARDLAEDGLRYARSGPQSVRLTINGAARAMGKLGDTEGVNRAVDRAHDLLSRNDVPGGVPSSISFECYSAAQTASNAATAYVSLGMPDKVQYYIGLALPDISKSESPWSRSLVMIDLAFSLIRAKDADLDRASALVLDALGISSTRPIVSIEQRTSEFLHYAAERWGNIRQVGAVREAASALKTSP